MGGISLQLPCQLKCAVGCCESAMQRAAFSPQTEPHPAPISAPRDSRRHRRRGRSAAPGRGRQSGAAGHRCRTAGPAWRTSGSGRGCGQWWPAAPARGQSPPRTAPGGKGEGGKGLVSWCSPYVRQGLQGDGAAEGSGITRLLPPWGCRTASQAQRPSRRVYHSCWRRCAPRSTQPQHVCNS